MLVYEQAGSAYMRFNSAKTAESSWLVQLQERVMKLILLTEK